MGHSSAEAIRPPFEKINGAFCQAQRLFARLGRVHDANHTAGHKRGKYGIAFGLGARISCVPANCAMLG